jgi:hypothetical protein
MDQARILLCDLCSPGELGCGRRQDAVKIQRYAVGKRALFRVFSEFRPSITCIVLSASFLDLLELLV